MKIVLLPVAVIAFSLLSCNQQKDSDFPLPEYPYFDQTPPGTKAEMFAYDLVNAGGSEGHIIISPDGTEILFSVTTPKGVLLTDPKGVFGEGYLFYSEYINGSWTEPTEFLPNRGYRIHYPSFSPNGNRLVFNSYGKRDKPSNSPESRIWFIDRTEDGWSEPTEVYFGPEYKGEGTVYPTIAANGNLYFAQFPDRQHGYLYVSRYEKGAYSLPAKLSENINQYGGNHPYIAPDESYIIYDWEVPGNITQEGANDLYLSFRDEDGEFQMPINPGTGVNSVYDERRAFVTGDGEYLFFASARINPDIPKDPVTISKLRKYTLIPQNSFQHLYWVEAKFIKELAP